MNENKLDIFIAKMKIVASNGSSGPENTTDSGNDPMMQRWLYGLTELVREQDEKILRLCKYPNMMPDELLVAYAEILVCVLERGQKLRLFTASSNDAIQSVIAITKRLDIIGKYVLSAKILSAIAYEEESIDLILWDKFGV